MPNEEANILKVNQPQKRYHLSGLFAAGGLPTVYLGGSLLLPEYLLSFRFATIVGQIINLLTVHLI